MQATYHMLIAICAGHTTRWWQFCQLYIYCQQFHQPHKDNVFFAQSKNCVVQISNKNGFTRLGALALDKMKGRCDPAGHYARMLTNLVTG